MISAFFPQRFAGRGNDGATYYLNQVNATSDLWWYGEDPELGFTHVYRGRLSERRGTDFWSGSFVDVPKGLACASGFVNWEMQAVGGIPTLRRTTARSPFGGTRVVPLGAAERPLTPGVARQVAGYVGSGLENITGLWLCDDTGSYYIREVTGRGEIAWVGENPAADPAVGGAAGSEWVNVLMGRRIGSRITAEWSDVPKGLINNAGRMTLAIENPNLITVREKTGGFGGNRWVRVEELELQLRFTTLTVVDQQEWFFEGDEPYFLALIALLDGRSVDLTRRLEALADFSNSFVAPKLADNVGAGTVIDLTSLPVIRVPFRPVNGDDGSLPILGLALRGAEQDWSGPDWRANRLADWVSTGGGALNRALQTTGRVDFPTNVARWHESFTWADEDDIFG
ncbi:MAG: hypothetical protein ABL886_15880, partial [Rhodoglobus sp.]